MRNNWIKAGVLTALTGACLWFIPSTAEAQRRGGGGRGQGGTGVYVQTPGGFSVGVGSGRSYGGYGGYGYGGYGYGGYRGGYYDRGYYPRYSSYGYSTYGYRPWYSSSYGSYYSRPSYVYPSTPYYAPQTVYYEAETPTVRSDAVAHIMVHVPSANAEVWLDGQPTSQRGMERTFMTPRLNPGSTYTYEVRARWTENGQPIERTRTVRFQTGQTIHVDFNQ